MNVRRLSRHRRVIEIMHISSYARACSKIDSAVVPLVARFSQLIVLRPGGSERLFGLKLSRRVTKPFRVLDPTLPT